MKIDKKKFWDKKILNWERTRYGSEFSKVSNYKINVSSSSLIERFLIAKKILIKIIKNHHIIEIGCGSGFLAKENGKIPLFGGIISSSIMLSGMIILGSIFEETGVAITYVMSFSILCLFYSICSRKSRQT